MEGLEVFFQQVFNRLIEDQINVNALQQAVGPWVALLQADGIYEQALANTAACDSLASSGTFETSSTRLKATYS